MAKQGGMYVTWWPSESRTPSASDDDDEDEDEDHDLLHDELG